MAFLLGNEEKGLASMINSPSNSNHNKKIEKQRRCWVFKSRCASSDVVGIICPLPLDEIGLTELPKSGWANAHHAHLLTASLFLTILTSHQDLWKVGITFLARVSKSF